MVVNDQNTLNKPLNKHDDDDEIIPLQLQMQCRTGIERRYNPSRDSAACDKHPSAGVFQCAWSSFHSKAAALPHHLNTSTVPVSQRAFISQFHCHCVRCQAATVTGSFSACLCTGMTWRMELTGSVKSGKNSPEINNDVNRHHSGLFMICWCVTRHPVTHTRWLSHTRWQ